MTRNQRYFSAVINPEREHMPDNSIVVCDGLGLQIGSAKAALKPSEAFTIAEALIRGATRAIVEDEADRALVRDALDAGD
jgi:hypothetical protein